MKNVGISKMKKIIEKIKAKIRGTIDLERLIKDDIYKLFFIALIVKNS